LGYADDTDIIIRSVKAIIEASVKLEKAAQQIGLKVNKDKTKYMEITSNPTGRTSPTINNYKFETVKEFKYLGMMITSDNKITTEITHRLVMANKC
jgi:hypothetical protein